MRFFSVRQTIRQTESFAPSLLAEPPLATFFCTAMENACDYFASIFQMPFQFVGG